MVLSRARLRAVVLIVCAAIPAVAAPKRVHRQPKTLKAAIEQVLGSDPSFARAHIGIEVADLATGAVLYTRNEQQLFIPASNTKLLTTTAAFAILGTDWKTRTTVESAHPIGPKGDLDADLVLVGRGDPNLSGRVVPYSGKTERTEPPLKPLE